MRQLARAPAPRPPATPMLAPARGFGPVTRPAAAHDLSRMSVSAPAPRGPSLAAPIQRRVDFNDDPITQHQLDTLGGDADGRAILANWHGSQTQHSFESVEHLQRAIGRARAQPQRTPDLFDSGRLQFLTQADNREPTLYFRNDTGTSGRLRQQHKHGPHVETETNKTDYFFTDKAHKEAFKKAAAKAHDDETDFDPSTLKGVPYSTQPSHGAHHLEVTYGQGRKVANVHPSQGRVVTNLQGYDNNRIRAIYQRIIGRAR